eukprot:3928600-Prymnesium_polylepis.1
MARCTMCRLCRQRGLRLRDRSSVHVHCQPRADAIEPWPAPPSIACAEDGLGWLQRRPKV